MSDYLEPRISYDQITLEIGDRVELCRLGGSVIPKERGRRSGVIIRFDSQNCPEVAVDGTCSDTMTTASCNFYFLAKCTKEELLTHSNEAVRNLVLQGKIC